MKVPQKISDISDRDGFSYFATNLALSMSLGVLTDYVAPDRECVFSVSTSCKVNECKE